MSSETEQRLRAAEQLLAKCHDSMTGRTTFAGVFESLFEEPRLAAEIREFLAVRIRQLEVERDARRARTMPR